MIWIVLLSIVSVVLIFYNLLVRKQIRQMRNILENRRRESSREIISIQMLNSELTKLSKTINQTLLAEENLRLSVVSEENHFKRLIANISHDLRTPLTAIKGYQQLLQKGTLTPEQEEQLRIAMKHTEELGELIDKFFEYSYLVNQREEVELEKLNLTAILEECLIGYITVFEEKGKNVHYEEAPAYYVAGERSMMSRCIQNLIRNGLQHAKGDIDIALKKETETITLTFTNQVEKPEQIDIERLFDQFYTGDSARRTSGGLGLSIVKLLAKKMGGSVAAEMKESVLSISVSFLCK